MCFSASASAAVSFSTTSAIRISSERNIQKPSSEIPTASTRLIWAWVLRMAPRSCSVQAKISSGTTATSAKIMEAACSRPCCLLLASSAIRTPLPRRSSDRGREAGKDFQRRAGWCPTDPSYFSSSSAGKYAASQARI